MMPVPTAPQAVELLARNPFRARAAARVIAVTLPHLRQYMHLDTVMTRSDRDAFCIFPDLARDMRAWSLRPGEGFGEEGAEGAGAADVTDPAVTRMRAGTGGGARPARVRREDVRDPVPARSGPEAGPEAVRSAYAVRGGGS